MREKTGQKFAAEEHLEDLHLPTSWSNERPISKATNVEIVQNSVINRPTIKTIGLNWNTAKNR